MNNKTRWVTQTGMFIALLVVLQFATAPLGSTLITGSVVNFLLITSAMVCGRESGICVAMVSPIMAKLIGIGPFWMLIPFIMLGNVTIVLLWHTIANLQSVNRIVAYGCALVAGAVGKFLVLYVGIVKIAIPFILALPEKQAQVISVMFSVPQLVTALVGGALAFVLVPRLKKAIGQHSKAIDR